MNFAIVPIVLASISSGMSKDLPPDGVRLINAFQEYLYKLYEKAENFRGVLYKGVGHEYTPDMWQEMLNWLKKHLWYEQATSSDRKTLFEKD